MQGFSPRKYSIYKATTIIPTDASKNGNNVLLGSLVNKSINVPDPSYLQYQYLFLEEHPNLLLPS